MHDPDVLVFDIRSPRRKNGYRKPLVNVWHHEPGGRDSGEVCKHYIRHQEPDGTWKGEPVSAWKWHVHHYRIQAAPLQAIRRSLLTRCAWCGGRSTKGNPANISHQWHALRRRWWKGELGLYHHDCSPVATARNGCSCEHPITTDRWGECARCGQRLYGRSDLQREANRILIEMVPEHTAPTPEVMSLVRNLWATDNAQTTENQG